MSGREESVLTPEEEDALRFAHGQLKYLEGGPSPAEPGPGRRGWRLAKRVSEAIGEPVATEGAPMTEQEEPD
jgi:hypothetical protein